MNPNELYIGIMKVTKPWIMWRVHSDRPEAHWVSKVAVIPDNYPLIWNPSARFEGISCQLRAIVMDQEFQGRPVAFDDGKEIQVGFSIHEHEAVLNSTSPQGNRPYHIHLDMAVVETGWSSGIIKVGSEVWEYMEGRLKIIEGTTLP